MKLPPEIIAAIEAEMDGLPFGVVSLELHVHDRRLARFVVGRTRSVVPGASASGSDSSPRRGGTSVSSTEERHG